MIARYFALMIAVLVLVACAIHEGSYSPACPAYAGSRIELGDGQFAWEKFTDSIVVDNDDAIVKQFPGYPMRGNYRIEGQLVVFESAAGDELATLYFQSSDAGEFLLTAEQQQEWENSGKFAECALIRGK